MPEKNLHRYVSFIKIKDVTHLNISDHTSNRNRCYEVTNHAHRMFLHQTPETAAATLHLKKIIQL